MEVKFVLNEPKSGKSYSKSMDSSEIENLFGKKIGDEIDLSFIGLDNSTGIITGGSYMTGTPMKKGIDGIGLKKVLIGKSLGNRTNVRLRKSLAGESISQFTSQINIKITKLGVEKIDEILGKKDNG